MGKPPMQFGLKPNRLGRLEGTSGLPQGKNRREAYGILGG
ncbi:hypothetical protein TCCBUS3UF1_4330 [Thermus sp. CCB_US3_UF1]|nr:hypothetical protein TCCBUS3UF1_4330 [Thermus sp. CCB_US3_UF1]